MNIFPYIDNRHYICRVLRKQYMNKLLNSLLFASMTVFMSCAGSYDIKGTSDVSMLDGKMLYLKAYSNSDMKTKYTFKVKSFHKSIKLTIFAAENTNQANVRESNKRK